MKSLIKLLTFVTASAYSLIFPYSNTIQAEELVQLKPIYDYKVKSIEGADVDLHTYLGKVLLIVNTASKCGFTSQYNDLEALYKKYNGRGFEVLGFPANDFGDQEPGSNSEIKEFCKLRFGVSFPLFEKAPVSGAEKQPLFTFLTEEANKDLTGSITWNFEKFIIDREGRLVDRYGSFTNPMSTRVTEKIESLLEKNPT